LQLEQQIKSQQAAMFYSVSGHFCRLILSTTLWLVYRVSLVSLLAGLMINEFAIPTLFAARCQLACCFDLIVTQSLFSSLLSLTSCRVACAAAESYQYQLQSMWQKCWNSQNLVQHMRFRERGPLKSWRPETMAEAIFSVLKEGLSLSQAARKYDIPYPTFVLYANRVHNMLGPSMDGGTDLRPKGRGRPQRILLGIWPDEHIKGVIKSVVFRDEKNMKEEHMIYGRQSVSPLDPRLHVSPIRCTAHPFK